MILPGDEQGKVRQNPENTGNMRKKQRIWQENRYGW